MCLEIVDPAVDQAGGVEDAVTAMDHVVVERDHHQRRVGDDASELTGIERANLTGWRARMVRSAATTSSGASTFSDVETDMPTLYLG